MNILHVIPSLDPSGGGPPAVVVRTAAAQAALGHTASILTYSQYRPSDSPDRIRKALSVVPGIQAVHIVNLDPADRAERFLARGARSRFAQLQPDVVHMHGVWEPLLPAIAAAARRRRIPYIVRPAGMLDIWSLRQRAWKKRLALALVHGRMLRHAAFIHALNRDEASALELLKLPTPVRVIPNGVFLSEIEPLPAPGSFHARHPELRGQPYILFLSRLHFKKGLDYLADAFSLLAPRHPEVRLVVAGPDDGYQAEFARQVAAKGLSDRVHIVGGLYGDEKIPAIVDAACFCLPSRQEGFSVAITEALACGTPVVVSKDCHFPEVAEVGAGSVVPLEPTAIAAALEQILTDPALRQRMSRAAAALIRARFTWPVIAQSCIDGYTAAATPN